MLWNIRKALGEAGLAQRVAMFDLGRTLVGGDPAVMLARHLRSQGRFGDGPWERLEAALVIYHSGKDMDRAVDLANEAFASGFTGLEPGALRAMASAFIPSVRESYYDYTLGLVAALRERGCLLLGVTGVAEPLCSLIGEDIGLDRMYGTHLETADGKLTGRTLFENGSDWKAARVRPILAGADREASLAFGDSEADVSMLALVGRPIVVNPKPAFEERVRALGWPVMRQGEPVAEQVLRLLDAPAWNAFDPLQA